MSSCSFCGGLVLKPDTAYGINPSAVCKCPHPHVEKPSDPQPLQTIDAETWRAILQAGLLKAYYRGVDKGGYSDLQLQQDMGSTIEYTQKLIEYVIGSDDPGETNVMIAMEHAEQRKRLTSIMKGTNK
jgi:hypothetical protein